MGSVTLSNPDAIGECISACESYNANVGSTQCDYGQIWWDYTLECTLWASAYDQGDTGSPSDRYEFAVTTDPTLIAQAINTCPNPPALALVSPTAIAGDPVNGSPSEYNDVVWPVWAAGH